MDNELPQHLKATADLLTRSLKLHPLDTAPPLPEGLVQDLSSRFSPSAAKHQVKISWFEKARSIISTPSFGLAAAALMLFGFIAPSLVGPGATPSNETFRGTKVVYSASDAKIVLITEDSTTRRLLEDSGLFDMSAVIETADPIVAASISSAKLLVDVRGGAIVGYNAESREILADQLPSDPDEIAERIALAFGAIQ